ncbi:MAG: class I SAM-dependent methyltransferase [Planctomycetes bacterium]|jgi:hypothetical protein|nr:class I SAM-dependent methyltransferase [Planctomycetota bacterium]
MNALGNALGNAIDDLVRPTPDGGACGYHDSQPSSCHEPVIEHTRRTLHEFLAHVQRHGPLDTVLQIGLGRRGGTHRAFRLLARRVVTIERDAARVQSCLASHAVDPERDVLLLADSGDDATRAAVAHHVASCDLLFLDGGDTYSQCAADWRAYAPLVRPGGLVAIADRSQIWPGSRRPFDVDRFAFEVERQYLLPRGVRMVRFGADDAIHCYCQPAPGAAGLPELALPKGFVEPTTPRLLAADHGGFSLHATSAGVVAVADPVAHYDERARLRNEYRVVLQHRDRRELERLVDVFVAMRAVAATALDCLGRGDLAGFARIAAEFGPGSGDVIAALLPSLLATPDNRELLRVFGVLQLLRGEHDIGAAVLRRLLSQQFTDSQCLRALAQTHLQLRRDEPAARQLAAEVRQRLRQLEVERICHRQLSGHALWAHPRCLRGIERCLWVGNGGAAGAAAWSLLGLGPFRGLHGNADGSGTFVAGASGMRQAWLDREHGLLGFHRWSTRFANQSAGRTQQPLGAVPTTTLDELLQRGELRPDEAQLLVIDVPGEEVAVLRGAAALLPHVDLVCVSVYHHSVFEGIGGDRELLDLMESASMVFLGSEPTPLGHCSHALFRRSGLR